MMRENLSIDQLRIYFLKMKYLNLKDKKCSHQRREWIDQFLSFNPRRVRARLKRDGEVI